MTDHDNLRQTIVDALYGVGDPLPWHHADSVIAALTTAGLHVTREGGWQPIATAPTDGPFIAAIHVSVRGVPTYWQMDIVSIDDETGELGRDYDFGWSLSDYTHWMPQPAPPSPKVAA